MYGKCRSDFTKAYLLLVVKESGLEEMGAMEVRPALQDNEKGRINERGAVLKESISNSGCEAFYPSRYWLQTLTFIHPILNGHEKHKCFEWTTGLDLAQAATQLTAVKNSHAPQKVEAPLKKQLENTCDFCYNMYNGPMKFVFSGQEIDR